MNSIDEDDDRPVNYFAIYLQRPRNLHYSIAAFCFANLSNLRERASRPHSPLSNNTSTLNQPVVTQCLWDRPVDTSVRVPALQQYSNAH